MIYPPSVEFSKSSSFFFFWSWISGIYWSFKLHCTTKDILVYCIEILASCVTFVCFMCISFITSRVNISPFYLYRSKRNLYEEPGIISVWISHLSYWFAIFRAFCLTRNRWVWNNDVNPHDWILFKAKVFLSLSPNSHVQVTCSLLLLLHFPFLCLIFHVSHISETDRQFHCQKLALLPEIWVLTPWSSQPMPFIRRTEGACDIPLLATTRPFSPALLPPLHCICFFGLVLL